MIPTQLDPVMQHLRRLADTERLSQASDAELVERFLAERDEAAFVMLVERHSRLVWSVCRQLLGHQEDAEDAFQATFLVLARRARTLRRSQAVAAWLHRVAQRISPTFCSASNTR
jgi:DNA-directed RNA polymerase specialized sigma24 family protein